MEVRSTRDWRLLLSASFLVLVLAFVAAVPVMLFRAHRRINDRLVVSIDPLVASVARIDALVLDEIMAERSIALASDDRSAEEFRRAHAALNDEWPRVESKANDVGDRAPDLIGRLASSVRAWEASAGTGAAPQRLADYRRAEAEVANWLRAERYAETVERQKSITRVQVASWILSFAGLVGVGALMFIVSASRGFARRAEREASHHKAKDEFLSVVAHELKTPLAVIRAQAQSLRRRATDASTLARDERQRHVARQLETIERQTTRLTHLIGEILDVSRLQMGRLELQKSRFDLGELAAHVVEEVQAAEPRWVLSLDPSPSVPDGVTGKAEIHADPERIEQVLVNLLTNAVKYSAPGTEVKLTVERSGDEIICSVADQGIGVPEQDRAHLFDRYYRASNAGETRAKGMGLGLHVSHEIVKRHGGRMWMESAPGGGSVFRFALAAAPAHEVDDHEPPKSSTGRPSAASDIAGA